MQVVTTVLVERGTPDHVVLGRAEFAVERQVPPGFAIDRMEVAERRPPGVAAPEGVEAAVVRAVALPCAVTRRDAPVWDLPPERAFVNQRRQSIHPLVEHRPMHA